MKFTICSLGHSNIVLFKVLLLMTEIMGRNFASLECNEIIFLQLIKLFDTIQE